jgi:hypothetical protein
MVQFYKFDLFFSYSHKNSLEVKELFALLKDKYNLRIWLDENNIEDGEDFSKYMGFILQFEL